MTGLGADGSINPFLANVPILYDLWFPDVFRGYRDIIQKWVNLKLCVNVHHMKSFEALLKKNVIKEL